MTPEKDLLNALALLHQGAAGLIDYPTRATRNYHVQVDQAEALLHETIAPKKANEAKAKSDLKAAGIRVRQRKGGNP